MSQRIQDFVPPSCELLALGEPTHLEPACQLLRNELFGQLVEHGFRSIALETDRVAALAVDDFVRAGVGTLDAAMSDGFSHRFGELDGNRRLVAWMREYNEHRPAEERLAFHGFDAPTETLNAPSPRRYLEHTRDYLGLDLDIAGLAGDDERWNSQEAILDATRSPGATADAERLRGVGDDLLTSLYTRAPELIAKTSRATWLRARTYVTAGLFLLRYHRQSAQRIDETARINRLCALRDAFMAQNLLDLRDTEARRGPMLVFAHNLHLQRNPSHMRMGPYEVDWHSAGAIVAPLLDERYTFIAGSLGRSDALSLHEPEPGTYESFLRDRTTGWRLAKAAAVPSASTRTDPTPEQGYFPLDEPTLDGADAVLYLSD
ncbi:erythromycin esterase family protein [Actinophytocola sp.]|uniref:erythromycin esterase family protein n=1 Tax=Actinophytocola sp. TaxID=1872138 RepID=UPI00389A51AB